MISYEETMQIKILLRQGHSIREISKLLKISRNTVRRYLRKEGKPSYKQRPGRPSKLSPFYDYLKERVRAAYPHWLPATVLFREIQALGYCGSIRLVSGYLQTLKPVKKEEPVVRFETAPGQQMQADWIVLRRGKESLSAFVATLGHSRASFVEFVTDERLETLLDCHEKAFTYFGGVPKEVLYDNMKTVVVERNAYSAGQHRFQPGFLDFAKHYGFMPKLCQPYRAKTKGKVERFNRYLRYSFYNPLVSRLKPLGLLLDAELANYEVKRWLFEVANQRVHATTGLIPSRCLDDEKASLQPLPPSYTGIQLINPKPAGVRLEPVYLQHSLHIYDCLLQEVY